VQDKVPITMQEVTQMLGEKDIEIALLRKRVRELEQQLQEVKNEGRMEDV